MARIKKSPVGRRGFLKGAAAGAAVLVTKPELAKAQEAEAPAGGGRRAAAVPSEATVARENGNARPRPAARVIENPGSDHMVDVIKSLGVEYVAFNPGSSFEGLHESLINYGKNTMPEIITCPIACGT